MLDFLVLCNAIGKTTVYRQVKKESPNFTFADITIQVGSDTLTVKELITSLEELMNLEKGSIYETVLKNGGEDLAKEIYNRSYKVFIEKINSKILENQSYAQWLQSLTAEGISLNSAIVNAGYWQTVYETNLSSLYSIGRQQETERLKEFIEFERYNAILDGVTTPICQDLDGKTRKAGTWGAYYPPNHYNCRSIVDIITKYRAKQENIRPDRFDLRKQKFPDKNFNRKTSIKDITKQLKKA